MTWQYPLLKLSALVVVVPAIITYLHLYYYTFWQNEYCLVGPHASLIHGTINRNINNVNINIIDNNEILADSVGFRSDLDGVYGIYRASPSPKKKGGKEPDRPVYVQKYASRSPPNYTRIELLGWPSLTQSATMIASPSSTLSKYATIDEWSTRNLQHKIVFAVGTGWCIESTSRLKWCSGPLNDSELVQYPPSGVWQPLPSYEAPPLSVSCPRMPFSPTKQSKHKQQNNKQNQNLQFILHQPATTILLLLNTGLAYHHWNHRISPNSVCKSYDKICNDHEWWRSFSGATAHFEPLHLGFNMMSLYTLGKELEGGYGGVVFLVYNIALVVATTAVMMGMVYTRLTWVRYRMEGADSSTWQRLGEEMRRLRETSTVGYSAVLFAWMVITTLERNQATCPVPFFADLCFSTHHVPWLPWLKFNIAPIVSLFVAQFIMPRVSFMGHLAGIACGFGLHWGWGMPPLEVCSPNVLVGGVYLVGSLMISRRFVPVRPLSSANTSDGEADDGLCLESCRGSVDHLNIQSGDAGANTDSVGDALLNGKRRKEERELSEVLRKQRTLLSIRNLMGIVTFSSIYVFDLSSSLVSAQFFLLAYFAFGTQASLIVWRCTHAKNVENEVIDREKQRTGVIWRGFIVACTLTIVVDSMSVASWFVLQTIIWAERYPRLGLIPACLFVILRTFANILGLVVSSKVIHDFGQVGGGIFPKIFSWVLSASKQMGDGLFMRQLPLWTSFEGRGVRLGSRVRTP